MSPKLKQATAKFQRHVDKCKKCTETCLCSKGNQLNADMVSAYFLKQ